MKRHSEKGSALLIVLGFLSFMVVSAVAFAVWMRTERLPSSALRRTVANRYLVKAALAQAMSQVDDAIRSHVFPGAWNTNDQAAVYRDRNNSSYDWWEGRVFMPPDPEGNRSSTDRKSRYAPISKTISVLNLEALGYLPPSIANDVRLLHRSSWAAAWDYFNFDAGRFAFCAVNVSDMLDVNKAAANAPRTSAASARAETSGEKPPASRFSYASLFRSGDKNFSSLNGGADKFDKCIHEEREEWKDAPMVSMMDYNLSVGQNTAGDSFWSPFYEIASGRNNSGLFYQYKNANDGFVKSAERQPFITDSWYPENQASALGDKLDISVDQPFEMSELKNEDTLLNVFNKNVNRPFWDSSKGNDKKHGLSFLDVFTLRDYLDEDSVPLSLCMPCVERMPMLAAMEPVLKMSVKFETSTRSEQGKSATTGTDVFKDLTETKITIKVEDGAAFLNSLVAFPFKEGQTPPAGCSVEAFARVVFVSEANAAAGGTAALPMRNNEFAKLKPLKENEWNGSVSKQFRVESATGGNLARNALEDCLVVTLPADGENALSLSENDDNGRSYRVKLKGGSFVAEKPIVTTIQEYNVVNTATGSTKGSPIGTPRYQVGILPFSRSGGVITKGEIDFGKELTEEIDAATFAELCTKIGAVRPYLMVWARIKYDGKTVDLVPATIQDDQILNGVGNTLDPRSRLMFSSAFGMVDETSTDGKLPIMPFTCATSFDYAQFAVVGAAGGSVSADPIDMGTWSPKAFFTVDPRFNWAPEDWYSSDDDISKWRENVFKDDGILDELAKAEHGDGVGRGDRAPDPFLFVSNQGYLQSIGELCFLPHLSLMDEHQTMDHNLLGGDGSGEAKGRLYDGVMRTRDIASVKTMPSWRVFWKSYQNFRTNPKEFEFGANMYRRGAVNGSQGLYVNPFTQSHEVMLTALANTPLNYWVTSTNTTFKQDVRHQEWDEFSNFQKWTFGEGGQGARVTGEDIRKIATFLQHRFEDLASMVEIKDYNEQTLHALQNLWADMFDALDWSGRLGMTVGEVYDDLREYYQSFSGGGDNNVSYSGSYTGSDAGYRALNRIGKGTRMSGIAAGIKLEPGKAIHKSDLSKSADPLAGEVGGGNGTQCRDEFDHVDRMFLHSYWRDCFASKQQLFLIFVRAEATALGAAGEGSPPQQGGRAVALVWRDPLPQTGTDVWEEDGRNQYLAERRPHRMRVLFYRQFD